MKKYTKEELLKLTIEKYGEDWENVKIKRCLCHGNGRWVNTGHFTSVIIDNTNEEDCEPLIFIDRLCPRVWNRNGMIFDGENWAETRVVKRGRRTKVELLRLLKENFIKGDPKHQYGLCREVDYARLTGLISHQEVVLLCEVLNNNRPKHTSDHAYYWPRVWEDPSTKQLRIDFLDKLIEKYED